jgi:hypothetical protein
VTQPGLWLSPPFFNSSVCGQLLFCCGRSPGVKIPKEGESRNDIISALVSARERVGGGGQRERDRESFQPWPLLQSTNNHKYATSL